MPRAPSGGVTPDSVAARAREPLPAPSGGVAPTFCICIVGAQLLKNVENTDAAMKVHKEWRPSKKCETDVRHRASPGAVILLMHATSFDISWEVHSVPEVAQSVHLQTATGQLWKCLSSQPPRSFVVWHVLRWAVQRDV